MRILFFIKGEDVSMGIWLSSIYPNYLQVSLGYIK